MNQHNGNDNNVSLDNLDLEDSYEPDLDNFESSSDGARNMPSYHSIHTCMQEIAKCEKLFSNETIAHMHTTLTRLLGTVVNGVSSALNNNSMKDNENSHMLQ